MALGATFGWVGRSGRHRFGSGGGRRSTLLAVLWSMMLLALAGQALGQQDPNQDPNTAANPKPPEKVASVSGNPGATNFGITGTGWLGRTLALKDESGVRLGGVWIADPTVLVAGGPQ